MAHEIRFRNIKTGLPQPHHTEQKICVKSYGIVNISTAGQCCGAGASRSRIILVEPGPQRDAVPAPASTAPKLMFSIVCLSKMSQTITISYFSHSFFY
jgi:hypothetical protein